MFLFVIYTFVFRSFSSSSSSSSSSNSAGASCADRRAFRGALCGGLEAAISAFRASEVHK